MFASLLVNFSVETRIRDVSARGRLIATIIIIIIIIIITIIVFFFLSFAGVAVPADALAGGLAAEVGSILDVPKPKRNDLVKKVGPFSKRKNPI